MWIYIYKFIKKRMLLKYKICLIIQDNQQIAFNITNIYIIILVARFFCIFMVLTARFDLELIQYNAINTFVHAKLDETVYMRILDEY